MQEGPIFLKLSGNQLIKLEFTKDKLKIYGKYC
jgi:hypothetical protein